MNLISDAQCLQQSSPHHKHDKMIRILGKDSDTHRAHKISQSSNVYRIIALEKGSLDPIKIIIIIKVLWTIFNVQRNAKTLIFHANFKSIHYVFTFSCQSKWKKTTHTVSEGMQNGLKARTIQRHNQKFTHYAYTRHSYWCVGGYDGSDRASAQEWARMQQHETVVKWMLGIWM